MSPQKRSDSKAHMARDPSATVGWSCGAAAQCAVFVPRRLIKNDMGKIPHRRNIDFLGRFLGT